MNFCAEREDIEFPNCETRVRIYMVFVEFLCVPLHMFFGYNEKYFGTLGNEFKKYH